jgi:hypothetical protein
MRDSIVISIPRVNLKSSDLTYVSAGLVGTVAAIQLCTDWNPLGRSFVFWKQLRGQVSNIHIPRLRILESISVPDLLYLRVAALT